MDNQFTVTINILSYIASFWIAFKIFDYRTKGRKRAPKDGLLLGALLLIFGLGVGTLFVYILKSWFDLV